MKKITLVFLFIFVGALSSVLLVGAASAPQKVSPGALALPSEVGQSTATSSKANQDSGLTLSVIALHNTSDDCYLAINNKVYNVSNYISLHPGGQRNIISRCGQEVTGIFASIHSNFAWDLLSKYYIGDLSRNQSTPALKPATSAAPAVLKNLKQNLKSAYPGAKVISISPKRGLYVAKMIQRNKLFEVHLDSAGNTVKVEVANDEYDWENWDEDRDDD